MNLYVQFWKITLYLFAMALMGVGVLLHGLLIAMIPMGIFKLIVGVWPSEAAAAANSVSMVVIIGILTCVLAFFLGAFATIAGSMAVFDFFEGRRP